jgi:lipase maturation factor 1
MIITSWAFSRWMALIYLTAFWSLGVQVLGLIGSHGILPVSDFLNFIAQQAPNSRFWAIPTLCWIDHSDAFLLFLCWGGAALSVLLFIGVMPAVIAFLLWLFYLSLTVAGQEFLGFQWDNLLLEAGFLLIFLVPRPLATGFKPSVRPSIVVVWLLRWLLFRLMFESGLVKLLSGDTYWSHLTALTYHYWTQPLPNTISWYADQLPLWFQKSSCVAVFAVELIMPFLIFCGRWGRLIAFFGITGLQLLIILTGNYCFFNLLTIGLCLTLLEDEHWGAITGVAKESLMKDKILKGGIYFKIVTCLAASVVLIVSSGLMEDSFLHFPLPKPVEKLITWVSPMRSINNYGLFAVMTTERNEIILEGSNDGEKWQPYEFRYKPGNVDKAPRWAMPYQPRLDWQMWFAALGSWRDNQWLLILMERLLQGEPSVERLLADDPFRGHPPRYIQATLWGYHFTDLKTKGTNGPWWRREIKGLYCPTVSLKD